MVTYLQAEPIAFNKKASEELKEKKILEKPEWASFVKTGHAKETYPDFADWWFSRGAAVLRSVALRGPIGVSKLRKKYGSNKNRGHKPSHKYLAGGKILRVLLQQLTKSEFVKDNKKGARKGKVLTPKGESFLNSVAKTL